MHRISWHLIGLLLIQTALGCGHPAGTNSAGASNAVSNVAGETPDKAVSDFLEAVRIGNDEKATSMLTPLARKKTAEAEMDFAPPASPTAKYEVGEVEYITPEKDGAHVWCRWTDVVDDQGHTRTDELIWVLRKESEGWRIAGMLRKVFPDRPPLVLNFEDPEDALRKQQLLHEEMEKSHQQAPPPEAQKEAAVPESDPAKKQ
jgi:hypothetical protein